MSDLAVRAHNSRLAGDIPRDVLPGLSNTFLTSEGSRKTEKDALKRIGGAPRLTPFHKRLIKLEQIAMNPKSHLDMRVKNRPARMIAQPMARCLWIASQAGVGMNAREVRMWLEDCDRVVSATIRAGYDPSILD